MQLLLIIATPLVFILVAFVLSWIHGVLPMYWGIGALVIAMISGFLGFHFLRGLTYILAPDLISQKALLIVAFGIGVVAYLVGRIILKWISNLMFAEDSFFHFLTAGIFGGLLSIIPSVIALFIISLLLRTMGTLKDLDFYWKLAATPSKITSENYPNRSQWQNYRDAFEQLPQVARTYDIFDPLNRLAKRHLVGLVVCENKPDLLEFIATDPDVAFVLQHPLYRETIDLRIEGNQLEFLSHPAIKKTAADPDLKKSLETMELQELINAYFRSGAANKPKSIED